MTTMKFRDEATGELCEVDLSSGMMLRHSESGTVESRVERGDEELEAQLASYAYRYERTMAMSAWEGGKPVSMDLGIADVTTEAMMPNFMPGYRNVGGVADIVSPIIQSSKPSAQYYHWSTDDAFQQVDNLETAPGAHVPEISPRLSKDRYATVGYALASFVPTEVEAAADAPLRPMFNATRRVINALNIAREVRVQSKIDDASIYDAAHLVDLSGDATKKWNGGASSDPLKDLMALIEAAYEEPTDIILSRKAYNYFVRNAAVQKFVAAKSNVRPMPGSADWAALLELPPFRIATMKYKSKTTGLIDYIWGGDVVLIHKPSGAPTDGQDTSSMYTFRWNGGLTPDGQMDGGILVRTFFDQKRGPRGGTMVVCAHNDADVVTSTLVGGLIVGAIQ